jgi:hypothetical protein
MTKTISWVLVAGVLIVGGYFAFNSKSEQESAFTNMANENKVEERTPTTPTASGKKIPFSELVKKQDGAYKCTVNQNMGGTDTQGTAYINQGMIRGEFNTKFQTMNIDSTFIVRDGFTYTWTSMLPNTGFKSKVSTDVSYVNPNASASGSYDFNSELIGDYDCQPWTVDMSKFVIPTNITFTENKY